MLLKHIHANRLCTPELLLTIREIQLAVEAVDAGMLFTKHTRGCERTTKGPVLVSPRELNGALKQHLVAAGWEREVSIRHPNLLMEKMDFCKNGVGLELQFGKYFAIANDLFKFCAFHTSQRIAAGVIVVPCKSLQKGWMSSGIGTYEKAVNLVTTTHATMRMDMPFVILGIDMTCAERDVCMHIKREHQLVDSEDFLSSE